jgi:hypothetical protein
MTTKYLSSKPVMHLFDQLPTDMIYYEIFPYLDYDSRVTANLLLPLKDRLRTPLRKDAVLEFAMCFGGSILISFVNKQGTTKNRITRNRMSLKIWRTVPLFPELFQYNSRFRAVISEKAAEFSDPSVEDMDHVTAYTRKELKRLCEAFLLSLETSYPYKREVATSSSQENWSAVKAL